MIHSIPTLWIGPPGVGKTATTISAYDYVEVVLLSTMTEEDISGLPYHVDGVEYRTEPQMFRRLRLASERGGTLALFLDELDKARREVADTLLTLVASRRVGEWVLPDNCDIVAAANPPEWGGGDGVSQAMQSRFCVRTFVPNVMQWSKWFQNQWKDTPHFEMAKKVSNQVECGDLPLLETAGAGWAWRLTCPRTLMMAFTAAVNEPNEDIRADIVRGLVTVRTADKFLGVIESKSSTKIASTIRDVVTRATRRSTSTVSLPTPLRIP